VERQTVKSSNIASIGYDSGEQVLEVEFKNGGVFQYADVEPKEYVSMLNADSVGRYLHSNIKGKFECLKVGGKGND
jgi:hypothetical protein